MEDSRFLGVLKERVLLGDGAYGTEFLRRGCLPGRPLDELNLTRPDLVLALHREYRDAGSELTKTNTFLANGFRLKPHGLDGKVREINRAGVHLAKEAARGGFVAGIIGPLTECPREERSGYYREQCEALAEAGPDALVLETFTEVSDLLAAVEAARPWGLPVIAQLAQKLERGFDRLVAMAPAWGIAVVGTNCLSSEETQFFVERSVKDAKLPISAHPSAGLPGQETTPRGFASTMRSLQGAGARLLGGCCGTGPDHIRAAALALGRGP
ncbi:MAG TPA: homocysteine S-methyltransferase family protein [Planctomycetota bacterium]|nr:homocysteine S-methyltransferase family protein [Planctomycetota bacterium]